ncbi:MAG: restriction endonuclease subunit S [Bacteroidales bacterium]|nr:restriction endonuclease subunit S [Bacteroidales bacterium]
MIYKLKNIVQEIKTGFSFRTKIIHDPEGNVAIIQFKDMTNNYKNIGEIDTWLKRKEFKSDHFLQKEDILFIAKGINNHAIVFDKEYAAIASSVFFVIVVDKAKVLPGYLAWYMNQKPFQSEINSLRSGSSTLNINKKTLEEMSVVVPDMETQNIIVNIGHLAIREHKILTLLSEKRNQIVEQKLLTKIKQS